MPGAGQAGEIGNNLGVSQRIVERQVAHVQQPEWVGVRGRPAVARSPTQRPTGVQRRSFQASLIGPAVCDLKFPKNDDSHALMHTIGTENGESEPTHARTLASCSSNLGESSELNSAMLLQQLSIVTMIDEDFAL